MLKEKDLTTTNLLNRTKPTIVACIHITVYIYEANKDMLSLFLLLFKRLYTTESMYGTIENAD